MWIRPQTIGMPRRGRETSRAVNRRRHSGQPTRRKMREVRRRQRSSLLSPSFSPTPSFLSLCLSLSLFSHSLECCTVFSFLCFRLFFILGFWFRLSLSCRCWILLFGFNRRFLFVVVLQPSSGWLLLCRWMLCFAFECVFSFAYSQVRAEV